MSGEARQPDALYSFGITVRIVFTMRLLLTAQVSGLVNAGNLF